MSVSTNKLQTPHPQAWGTLGVPARLWWPGQTQNVPLEFGLLGLGAPSPGAPLIIMIIFMPLPAVLRDHFWWCSEDYMFQRIESGLIPGKVNALLLWPGSPNVCTLSHP